MIEFSNAKINIGLNVVERRPDGYHNIETIFYPINWRDVIEVVPSECGGEYQFTITGREVNCEPEKNLVIKALRALKEEHHLPALDIYLRKVVPFGAGLGGGSANAAVALKLYNRVAKLGLSDKELARVAARLGADCAFFIYNQPMFGEGIGDQLTPVELSLKGYYFVLVKPNIHVSTPAAYASVVPMKPVVSLKELIKLPLKEWREKIVNDFEASVFEQFPAIGAIKKELYTMGAVYASMSGSGSSVFGLFEVKPMLEGCFPECELFETMLE